MSPSRRSAKDLLVDADTDEIPVVTEDVVERPAPTRRRAKPSRRADRAAQRRERESVRSRRTRKYLVIAAAAVFLCGAAAFVMMRAARWEPPGKDFAGPAGPVKIIQVHKGDTAQEIGQAMVDGGVVASAKVFLGAAIGNTGMSSLQPGYYAVPSNVPAAQAVTTLVDKASRVGALVISEGRQLLDSKDAATAAVKEGIYRKIVKASCVGSADAQQCVGYDDLAKAGATDDLAALGVPTWAVDAVRKVPDRNRQLEGLIAAGAWNFDPTAPPREILRQLIAESAKRYEVAGILNSGAAMGKSPYQMLTVASLVEREALPQDMPKVARVVFNRLAVDQPLQFDSTVNYALNETEVATTDGDRERVTAWNTYAMPGLPATPISSPSIEALKAVENPTPGSWLYFVTIDKQGTTLFTADYNEHLRNIKKAQGSGILDSAKCAQSGCPR